MKKNLIVLALLSAIAVLTPRSWAVNLGDAQLADSDQTAFSAIVLGGAGGSDLAHLYYVGTGTEALVTIAATHMDFFQPAAVTDTTIGASGVITYASTLGANTMGSLCDYINASATKYRCQLTGALRGDAPSILKTQTETTGTCSLAAAGGCKLTNNAADIIRVGIIPSVDHRVVLKQVIAYGLCTTDNIGVYGILRPWSSGFDNLGQAVTADTNPWAKVTGAASTVVYQPSQYTIAPWLEFANNKTPMSRDYGGHLTNPVTGTAYDGRVVVNLGVTGGACTQTSSDYILVEGSLK